uniref:Putative Fe-S oxidoreductase n=1 Tax=Magnetococcus massalia (strain MO-1) TaxID=451514 RepID=A0A1S7LLD4_MAGMO|nr:putative Fe-S oxidoreductase [Candidatus Magnetococcus massalia]
MLFNLDTSSDVPRLAPLKLPRQLQSRQGWAKLMEMQRTPQPFVHQIEVTNHCPYRCIMCPRDQQMSRDLGYMAMDLYAKLIAEMATFPEEIKARELELFHFGESLLHPQLDEMVAIASTAGLKPVLSVNPPHLKPAISERLLKAKPHRIILSIDGFDAQSYREIRGQPAHFAQAVKHVEALVACHRERNSETDLLVRMIHMHRNSDQVARMEAFWRSVGVRFEPREFFPWTESELAALGEHGKNPPHMPCPFPWSYLVVQWDGSVVGCCRDLNGENRLGNANQRSLQEIWGGPAYRQFRAMHAAGDFSQSPLCAKCDPIYFNPGE